MEADIIKLVGEIKNAATAVIGKDVSLMQGFSERQTSGLARQSKLLAAGIVSGEISEATRDFLLNELAYAARNFVRALLELTLVMIEKVWNAVINVIWTFLEKAIGIQLPRPAFGAA